MTNMISDVVSKALTYALNQKTAEELRKGRDKKVVAMPRVLRIFMYIITLFILRISSLGFILLLDIFPNLICRVMIIVFCIALFVICILYLLLSSVRIIYDDTEIKVTTFWFKKRNYNVLDIKKARSSLYFYVLSFSDNTVILTDSMTASSEFYNFAIKHAHSVKGKY